LPALQPKALDPCVEEIGADWIDWTRAASLRASCQKASPYMMASKAAEIAIVKVQVRAWFAACS